MAKRTEIIQAIAERFPHLSLDDVHFAVLEILNSMRGALARGQRIEIRGFGGFQIHYRKPRTARNPKTGDAVLVPGKYVPHFKAGKELREAVSPNLADQEKSEV